MNKFCGFTALLCIVIFSGGLSAEEIEITNIIRGPFTSRINHLCVFNDDVIVAFPYNGTGYYHKLKETKRNWVKSDINEGRIIAFDCPHEGNEHIGTLITKYSVYSSKDGITWIKKYSVSDDLIKSANVVNGKAFLFLESFVGLAENNGSWKSIMFPIKKSEINKYSENYYKAILHSHNIATFWYSFPSRDKPNWFIKNTTDAGLNWKMSAIRDSGKIKTISYRKAILFSSKKAVAFVGVRLVSGEFKTVFIETVNGGMSWNVIDSTLADLKEHSGFRFIFNGNKKSMIQWSGQSGAGLISILKIDKNNNLTIHEYPIVLKMPLDRLPIAIDDNVKGKLSFSAGAMTYDKVYFTRKECNACSPHVFIGTLKEEE